jgi:hypothetical protein
VAENFTHYLFRVNWLGIDSEYSIYLALASGRAFYFANNLTKVHLGYDYTLDLIGQLAYRVGGEGPYGLWP